MKRTLASLLIVAALPVVAEEAAKDKTPEWQGSIQFGFISTSGNTDNSSINGKFNLKHDDENWLHELNANYYSSSESDVTKAERYKLIYQADYKLEEENTYWFVNSSYENDRFSGFDYRATLSTGYGSRLYNENDMTFDAEIGAGLRYSEQVDPLTNMSDTENEAMIRAAGKYLWQIAEDRKLTSNLNVEEGEEVRVSNFDISFETMIVGGVSMKATYEARHVSEVPEGKEKLDTVVSLNLLYAF